MSGSLTSEQLARVAELERRFKADELITMPESMEYVALKDIAKRMTGPAEIADDPSTLFTDESSRPQLDGGNYNDDLHRMCRDEVGNFFTLLAAKFGEAAARTAMAAFLAKR